MTVLKVKELKNNELEVSYSKKHPKSEKIKGWLKYLGPGYIEYLLKFGENPHCNACRDAACSNSGGGDDACAAFKYGDQW